MKKQLDEHLIGEEALYQPKFFPLLKGISLYFVTISVLFVILYFILERANFNPFIKGELLYNIQEELIRFLILQIICLIPGYFLQRKMYSLYNQSVIRSAMVPILFFNFFLTISMINLFWSGEHQGESIWYIIGVWGLINSWLITLSLFISWYFSHQKKWLFFLCLLGHWMVYSVIAGFSVS